MPFHNFNFAAYALGLKKIKYFMNFYSESLLYGLLFYVNQYMIAECTVFFVSKHMYLIYLSQKLGAFSIKL